ncbi:DnaD domain-containing protein [Pseudogracilibacillus auburnensis]|nr:DnaD domain-containing protein [Pseudogracilibacillus auburnensis]MBO1003023.1 DnaD domain-containing protein [Pseudogracilibacillus auburnensis]
MTKNASFQQIFLHQLIVPAKLLTDYKMLGLNEQDVIILLQIHRFLQEKKEFPTPSEIASYLTISEGQCIENLRKLIQKNMLEIKELQNDRNQLSEAYSLDPLWEKLFAEKEQEEENQEGTIFVLFEQEFGRPLSPFEIETINAWLDEDRIVPALIKAALRESVLMGKLNFKYIDRILREWQRKGIHSVEQAREESKSFRKHQVNKQYTVKKRDTSVYFNWLKGGD